MKDFKYYNLKNLTLDLNDLLSEVEYLREENASLKNKVNDYEDFMRNLTNINQEFIGETIKQLIRR